MIKENCSQYQKVMVMAIVGKAFDNHDKNFITSSSNYTPTHDKFAFKAFNQLSYNRKINELLVPSYLVNLLNHYSSKMVLKTINIAFL